MEKTKLLQIGAAVLLTAGAAFAAYKINSARGSRSARGTEDTLNKPNQPRVEEEKKQEPEEEKKEEEWLGFEDPEYSSNKYLSKIEAENRSQVVSDVSYVLALGLIKGGTTFNGKVTIDYTLSKKSPAYAEGSDNSNCLFIDYKGKLIKSITINGKVIPRNTPNLWINHRIYIPVAR